MTAYFGNVETRTPPASYCWDGMKRLKRGDSPLVIFHLTLAGWGHFEHDGGTSTRIRAGTAFIATTPSRHRYYLPESSPGWTFAWLSIYHPYLLARLSKQIAITGPMIDVASDSSLAAMAVRLVRCAITKGFRDESEVELALFQFVVACEQTALRLHARVGESASLVDVVRTRVIECLPKTISVSALANEHGMSRTNFSHFFHLRTGLTPARFAAEVRIQEVARMLKETRMSLKEIAAACGFVDSHYLCKVFRRFQHMSPGAYRRAFR